MFTVEKAYIQKPRILVAEDDPSNYLLIEYLLKDGFTLIHARNGEEAIALFKTTSPDLILMDIKMPGTDGYAATTAIRHLSLQVPIIAVTACAFCEDKKKILSSGFNAYIQKPLSIEELKEKIAEFLAK